MHIRRFDRPTRLLHIVVMVTFLGLAATGLPLLFSDAPWSRVLAALFGGFRGAGLVHRFFGATLLVAVAWHVANIFWRAFVRGERGLFWGPDVDGAAAARRRAARPADPVVPRRRARGRASSTSPTGRSSTTGPCSGAPLLMGAAGLMLWFPQAASHVLPGWMFNVALFVHGAEATLAIGFIFVIHFFNGHLRPGKFPMDLVIFTGSVSDDELREERAGRVRAAGRDRRAGRSWPSPPPSAALSQQGTAHRHGRPDHRPRARRAHPVRGSSLIGRQTT